MSPNEPQTPEQRRQHLAVLEGHDADIPTADQASWGVKGAHTTTSHETPPISSYATAPATPQDGPSASSDGISLATLNANDQHTSALYEAPSNTLAPSTVAQWAPASNGDAEPGVNSPSDMPTSDGSQNLNTPTKQHAASEIQPTSTSFSTPTQTLSAPTVHSSEPVKALSTTPEAGTISSTPETLPKSSSELEKETAKIDLEAGDRSYSSSKKEPDTAQTEVDPNIVDWDGPDDPANPMNWSASLKWGNVAVIAVVTFLTQVCLL